MTVMGGGDGLISPKRCSTAKISALATRYRWRVTLSLLLLCACFTVSSPFSPISSTWTRCMSGQCFLASSAVMKRETPLALAG